MKKLLLLFLFISAFANAQILDQFYYGVANGRALSPSQNQAQSFTAGITGNLNQINMNVNTISIPGVIDVQVLGGEGLGGPMLAQQSFVISPSDTGVYFLNFGTPAFLDSGLIYTFIINCLDTTALNIYSTHPGSTYPGGICYDNGTPLTAGNGEGDLWFETFVTATGGGCANPITANPFVVSGATCGNNDAELSVNPTGGFGPYTYSWSPVGGTSQSTGATLAPGMYTVTVSDTSGCVAQGSVYAFASNPVYPTINIGSALTCSSTGSLYSNPSGGAGGYTFLWSTAATTQTISGLTSSGQYYVTVTDSLGCSGSDSIYLSDMTMQVIVNPYNTTCGLNNGYIYANANNASAPTYSWSGPLGFTSTSQNITNLVPGNYVLTVVDTACPVYTDTIVISSSSSFSISHTINHNITCNGNNDGSATVVINGGLGAGYVGWGNGELGMTAYNLPIGPTSVFVNDSIGCQGYDTIYITEPTILMDSLSFTEPSCGSTNGSVSVSVMGGTGPYSYFWSTGNMASNISGVDAGIYMVDVTDANGCVVSDVATLGSAGGATINLDAFNNITCNNADDGMIAVSITGGTAPYTVFWTDMDSSYTTLTRMNLQAGPYQLVVADASGCQTIFSTYVYEPSPITVNMYPSSPSFCTSPDGSIITNVNGGTAPYVYFWSNTSTASSISGLTAGVYTLTVTDANGCTVVNETFLSDPTILDAYGSNVPTNCGTNNGSIDIYTYNGSGSYSYQWTNGAVTEDISGLYPGNYGVTITDLFDGCVKALEFTVNSSTANYAPEVCLVTVDTLDEKNVIVWERPTIGGIAEFVIYRETSTPGVYRYIGTNPIDSLTEMKDTLANADLHAWKYRISAIDSCGVETGVSEVIHRPIFLTVDTNGVGLPSLVWTHYMGRPYSNYIVKRNANGTGWVDVVTLPATQNAFVDLNCPSGSIEYTIEALFTSTCEATRGAINTTRSNIKTPTSLITGIKGNTSIVNNVSLFPNPSQDNFTVSLANKAKENVSINVVNAMGQVIYTTTINEANKATTIAASSWNNGVYFVRINSTEMHSVIKFVKQ